jgi:PAS domain S-box-containing protein
MPGRTDTGGNMMKDDRSSKAYALLDEAGNIQKVSRRLLHLTGFSAQELLET